MLDCGRPFLRPASSSPAAAPPLPAAIQPRRPLFDAVSEQGTCKTAGRVSTVKCPLLSPEISATNEGRRSPRLGLHLRQLWLARQRLRKKSSAQPISSTRDMSSCRRLLSKILRAAPRDARHAGSAARSATRWPATRHSADRAAERLRRRILPGRVLEFTCGNTYRRQLQAAA